VLSDRRDALGSRLPRLEWRLGDDDLTHLRRTQEVLGRGLEAAGVGRLDDLLGDERPPALVGGGFHHLGTTRMSTSPTSGVVDPHGAVHGIAHLHVAGSSVFPTSAVANPTLTIVALALRLADRIGRELVRGGGDLAE
jgi:choline dehydrogenase-like flavoprotein